MGSDWLHFGPVRSWFYAIAGPGRDSNRKPLTHLQIIPDRTVDNKQVGELLQVVTSMYTTPLQRWNMQRKWFDDPDRAAWEILMTQKDTKFCLTTAADWQPLVEKQLSAIWPHSTVQVCEDLIQTINPSAVGKIELKEHFMFPLRTDHRMNGILPSLLDVTKLLGPSDRIAIQILLDPACPDWWRDAATAYEEFSKGKMPYRWHMDGKVAAMLAAKGLTYTVFELIGIVEEFMTGEQPKPFDVNGIDKATALREKKVFGSKVADKLKADAINVTIRVGVETDDYIHGQALLRGVWYAFRNLDADNSFTLLQSKPEQWQKAIYREPGFKINPDYLSIKEAEMLIHLPTGPLQSEYGLSSVDHRETKLPQIMAQGGLCIGNITYHGKDQAVYLPINDHDELCLPHIVIGGMGTGKTKGFGANLAVQAVKNGMGAIVIDPAKGELGDEIETVLPPDQIIRIRFGHEHYALDWREALHSERVRNRLANELVAFCEAATDEAGAQTVKFMRAAAKAAPGGRLSEVVKILTHPEYRKSLIPNMRDTERQVWGDFSKLTEARQMQIALPVLNRLDVIMGDDYLAQCMDAENGLDFVELLNEPKAIVIDIPKGELGPEGVDVLASLIATKLDLAMVLRATIFPVFVIQDEPHQYLKSARTWKAAAVESRKWRFCYTWMFHSWEQIPNQLAEIIKAAGPHYHLYTSSKKTYQELAEEIAPFTVHEAMQTKRHWAINVIRADGRVVPPFLAQMAKPPST